MSEIEENKVLNETIKPDTEVCDKDKIMATKDIETFFYWLNSIGEIEILGDDLISKRGAEALYGVRRSYTDRHIRYKFKGSDEINTVVIGDGDYIGGDEWGEELTERFKKYRSDMNEKGEYYIQGTFIPKYEVLQNGEDGIYDDKGKDVVILKEGKPCLVVNDANRNRGRKFCKANNEPYIYVSTKLKPEGYAKLRKENCVIR